MKIGVMALLALGVILVNPTIHMPAITKFIHGGGPIIPGKVWPFVFITIACGALSGFHSLIGSGTTPKLIDNERDILPISFGGMLVEGFVAMMALIAATSLIPADYFAINTMPAVFAKLGMKVAQLPMLSKILGESLAGRPGGGVSLAVGMSYIFSSIPGLKSLMAYLYHFVIMFEALFILSTVDTGTRVGRYLLQEAGGVIYKPLKNQNWWPGIITMSALISFAWGYLVYCGNITTIWPLFGVANQLLAAIALGLGTTLIISLGKVKYMWLTAIPTFFITVTTMYAAYLNIVDNYLPQHNLLLAALSGIILLLFVVIMVDTIYTWVRLLRNPNPDLSKTIFSIPA
jgi:carbon starvation protein